MALSFPPDCDTPRKRTEYCYRAQELLRLLHNVMGDWYRDGITKAKWDKLPLKVKNRYPYQPKLPQAEWHDFTNLFDRFEDKVIQPLLTNRQSLKESINWAVNVDSILEE